MQLFKKGWVFTVILILSVVFWMWCSNPAEKQKKSQEDTQAKIDSLVNAKKEKSGLK